MIPPTTMSATNAMSNPLNQEDWFDFCTVLSFKGTAALFRENQYLDDTG